MRSDIHLCEFVRSPFALFAQLQNGLIDHSQVTVISARALILNAKSLSRTILMGSWNFESYAEGERGGIRLRVHRDGAMNYVYTGAYIILLREPVYEFCVPVPSLGTPASEVEVMMAFRSLDDIMPSLLGKSWIYGDDNRNEIGATFTNQEDAVMFSAMYAANKM